MDGIIWCYAIGATTKIQTPSITDGENVKLFTDRQLHLVKKALALAMLAIEPPPGWVQPTLDYADLKALLREITESEIELAYYFIAARMTITGTPEGVPQSAAP